MAGRHAGHAMDMDEAMIVAGIGCRKGVTAQAVLAAVDGALAAHNRARHDIACLATGAVKKSEPAIVIAAARLGVPLHYAGADALADAEPLLASRSQASRQATGSPSLSEASALAVAGAGGKLLGPRTVAGPATCALAEMVS